MKYVVKIDYKKFTFDDRLAALDFAESAKIAVDDKDCDVSIDLIEEVQA